MPAPSEYMLFRVRRDESIAWVMENPIIPDGEMAYDTTQHKMKIGNGVTPWMSLPWLNADLDLDALTIPASKISDATAVGRAVLVAVSQDAARSAIGAGTGNGTSDLVLGVGPGTACAGDDPRLSDERVPLDDSVDTHKLQVGSVTTSRLAADIIDAISNAANNSVIGPGIELVISASPPSLGTPETTITVV